MTSRPLTPRAAIMLLLVCLTSLFTTNASATHVSGATLEYTILSATEVRVDVQVLQKCYETIIPSSVNLKYVSICSPTTDWGQRSLMLEDVSPVSADTCSVWTPGEDCPDGNGHFKLSYSGTFALNGGCDQYRIFFKECNRSMSVNVDNTDFPCLQVQSTVNFALPEGNTSSHWHNANTPSVCLGMESSYIPEVTDADGDSLSFALITGLQSSGGNGYLDLEYEVGYSGEEPIPGITIDPLTGRLDFTVYNQGSYVIAMEVSEYANGQFKSSSIRDFLIVAKVCTSAPLDMDGFGLSSLGGEFNWFSPDSIVMCPGQNVCAQVSFSSGEDEAVVDVIHDMAEAFPTAEVTLSGTNPTVLSFCIEHDGTGEYRTVEVDVTDNGCPIEQTIDYMFGLYMDVPMTDPELVLADEFLGLVSVPEGATFQWYRNGLYLSGQTESIIDVSNTFGDFHVVVTTRGGCSSTSDTVYVEPTVTSLEENALVHMNLYPNPTDGQSTITLEHGLDMGLIALMDATGRQVWSRPLSTQLEQIDVASLNNGLYLLLISDQNGRPLGLSRMMVK